MKKIENIRSILVYSLGFEFLCACMTNIFEERTVPIMLIATAISTICIVLSYAIQLVLPKDHWSVGKTGRLNRISKKRKEKANQWRDFL